MKHHDRCATHIDHALRCTCERERAWDKAIEESEAQQYKDWEPNKPTPHDPYNNRRT